MFELSLVNAKVFKDCVDAIATLIDEGQFLITPDGIKLRAMDPSQIAMVDMLLPKTSFEKYELSGETKIGLNLEDLSKVMSRCRAGEKLALKLDESKARIILTFKGQQTRRFNLPLLDLTAATPKQPNIAFESKIRMNSGALKEALKDTSLVASHVVLHTLPDSFFIEALGDKGNVVIETAKTDDVLLEHTVNAESRAMFPLEYLNDILKAADSGAIVTLDLKTDAPLRLSYNISDASVTYFLAPRIESA